MATAWMATAGLADTTGAGQRDEPDPSRASNACTWLISRARPTKDGRRRYATGPPRWCGAGKGSSALPALLEVSGPCCRTLSGISMLEAKQHS